MRCGNDSAQCILEVNTCDGLKNCRNGWDETAELCIESWQRSKYVAKRNIYVQFHYLYFVICLMCNVIFFMQFYLAELSFELCMLDSEIRVYHPNAYYFTKPEPDYFCYDAEPTCLLTFRVTNTLGTYGPNNGFVVYVWIW